jgi:hypothetical protein
VTLPARDIERPHAVGAHVAQRHGLNRAGGAIRHPRCPPNLPPVPRRSSYIGPRCTCAVPIGDLLGFPLLLRTRPAPAMLHRRYNLDRLGHRASPSDSPRTSPNDLPAQGGSQRTRTQLCGPSRKSRPTSGASAGADRRKLVPFQVGWQFDRYARSPGGG